MYFFDRGDKLLTIIIIIWSLLWKCYSVWLAAKNNDKKWFVALVILNTAGILDMIYVFGVAKKKWSDIKHTINKIFS
jgi:hypothetical protein